MKKDAEKKVRRILRNSTSARNSDAVLLLQYLFKYTALRHIPKEYKELLVDSLANKIPSVETLTRIRRKIQEGGDYLATKKVQKHRREKEKFFRSKYKR